MKKFKAYFCILVGNGFNEKGCALFSKKNISHHKMQLINETVRRKIVRTSVVYPVTFKKLRDFLGPRKRY